MKIAEYQGKQYKLIQNKRDKCFEFVTKKSENINNKFKKNNNIFYKKINDLSVLDDIYDISLFVEYDTHLKNVSNLWKIPFTQEYLYNEKIKLIFAEGILLGWSIEEKNVCSKYINIDQIQAAYIIKTRKLNKEEKKEKIKLELKDVEKFFNKIINI